MELSEAAAFAAIVRSSQDAVIAKTVDGLVTAWNDGATALYGWSSAQMMGCPIDVTFPAESVAQERARHAFVASGGSESGYRCTRSCANGGRVEVVMSMSPVFDDDGRIIGVASVSRRISVAEHDEARFASVLEAAPDAMVCVGPDGRIMMVNGQVSALFGYDGVELIGAELEILLPERMRERHVGHRMTFADDPRTRMMGSGLSLVGRRRDGTTFPVEVSLAPDRNSEGLVIAAVRDVSKQRELEAASRESEHRLRQLTDNVDIVFLLLRLDPPEYLYVSSNAKRILGYVPANEFAARGKPQYVHPNDVDRLRRDFHIPSRAGLPATAEHRVVTPGGAVKWFRSTASPVPNPSGPPQRTVITTIEITAEIVAAEALRNAEAAARAANDAKNQFLSRMSHELRTPLNAILGFGQLLRRHLAGTDQAEAVGHILKGGHHLLDLINDILDIARIEAGEMALSLEPVPIATVIDETVQLMGPLALDAGVSVNVAGGPAGTFVWADRQRLRQILLNLTSNAIKYNRPGGNVWVVWRRLHNSLHDQVSIGVRDDGQGISAELQSRLFTPFDRLGAESSGVDGTGIGLSLTRSLTDAMGGTITVESVPARGSTFTVILPATYPVYPVATQHPPAGVDPPIRSPLYDSTVLYIEDNAPNVRVMEHIVRLRSEWKLIYAALGRLGIALAQTHHPDLVLLDLHLPDLSGRDVLLALKSDPVTATIPVAILTADASAGLSRQLRENGAENFLTKPLDVEDILALLDKAAARKGRRG